MRPFGFRLALWYATLFIVSAIVIVFVTYWLTSISLAQRDQQVLQSKLGDYAAAYQRGGLGELAETVRAEQSTAPERLFVRVVDQGREAVVLSQPQGWDPSNLDADDRAPAHAVKVWRAHVTRGGRGARSQRPLRSARFGRGR